MKKLTINDATKEELIQYFLLAITLEAVLEYKQIKKGF